MNREQWLTEAAALLRPTFDSAGVTFPDKFRVSASFPGGGSPRKRIGECWPPHASGDGTPEVFVSPVRADSVDVLGTLAHELIHAGGEMDHKAGFAKAAKAIGLEGKPTAAGAGEAFKRDVADPIVAVLGEYPHAPLSIGGGKRQTTRMLKVTCALDDGYIVRMSRKALDEYGAPLCPCHHEEMIEA